MSTSKDNAEHTPMGSLVISLRENFISKEIALVLASQSPRRREILDMMGLADLYETIPSPLDETSLQIELSDKGVTKRPQKYTQTLAEEKARTLAESLRVERPTLVLGSDTIVDQDEDILEKPKDTSDAHRMLRRLSGCEHYVHTGVAIYLCLPDAPAKKMVSFVDQATVQFANLSDADIDAYVASGEPMDKAGSYGIQGIGGQFVTSVQGDFFTVCDRVSICAFFQLLNDSVF
jgi:septum formation protein